MSFETTVLLLTWVAILLLAFVVSGMVRRVHFLSTGVQPGHLGLAAGAHAPEFGRLAPGSPDLTVLLFLDRDCGVCPGVLAETRAVLAELAETPDVPAETPAVPAETPAVPAASARPPAVTALFSGPAHDDLSGLTRDDAGIAVLAGEAAAFEAYQIPAVPFAVLVDAAGRVQASRPVGSPGALRALLHRPGALGAIPGP